MARALSRIARHALESHTTSTSRCMTAGAGEGFSVLEFNPLRGLFSAPASRKNADLSQASTRCELVCLQ